MKKTAIELSDAEMAEALEKKKQERINRCRERILKVLEEEKCRLTAEMIIGEGKAVPNIFILPN